MRDDSLTTANIVRPCFAGGTFHGRHCGDSPAMRTGNAALSAPQSARVGPHSSCRRQRFWRVPFVTQCLHAVQLALHVYNHASPVPNQAVLHACSGVQGGRDELAGQERRAVATAGKPRDRIRLDKLMLTVMLQQVGLQHRRCMTSHGALSRSPSITLAIKMSRGLMARVYIGMRIISD